MRRFAQREFLKKKERVPEKESVHLGWALRTERLTLKAYKKFPALAAYIDRIGAEQLTFRSFMVKEYRANSYYIERCLIKVQADGEVVISNKDFQPTKEEREAIKKELAGHTDFPKCILASEAQFDMLLEKLGIVAYSDEALKVFQFWNLDRTGIIMAQQRIEKEDGGKNYLPWTLWSDGEWRCMEPDGGLPFWKPKQVDDHQRGGRKIMVHEGAKTASYVHNLCTQEALRDRLEQHPFGSILKEYTHWGMIGGALAPHRANYTELHKEKPREVVYVCDNDYPGNAALEKVSKFYGRSMKGIQFGKDFPDKFDLADPIPEHLLARGTGKYIGPKWFDMLKFATRATYLVPNPEGRGRPTVALSQDFAAEWHHVVKPEVYVHRDWPAVALTAKEFNHKVAAFADVDDVARIFNKDGATMANALAYDPSRKPGLYAKADGHFINTHVPSPIGAVKGDYSPFIGFMQHLVPDEQECKELMRWVATLIALPANKMYYGVLLISETQGIGKSTLGEKILAPLLGHGNVSYPSEHEITESNYNYWAAHKRLAVVHEIYAGHSAKAYNKLKSVITDHIITVSQKYMASYDIDNWVHVFACSNSTRAMQLSMDDRRWFVPRVTEKKKPAEYWRDFNAWLLEDEGLGKIRYWAEQFIEQEGPVMAGAAAPWSPTKKEMIEESYSAGMKLTDKLLRSVKQVLEGEDEASRAIMAKWEEVGFAKDGVVILVDLDFIEQIKLTIYEGRHSDRLEKPLTIRKVAKGCGFHVMKERLPMRRWGSARFNGRIITNSLALAEGKVADIPENLRPIPMSMLLEL